MGLSPSTRVGDVVEIEAGGGVILGRDNGGTPTTIAVPVDLDEGVMLDSFEDPATGIVLKDDVLTISLEDPETGKTSAFIEVRVGEVVGTGKMKAEAPIEEIRLQTAEQRVDFDAQDSDVGLVGASLNVELLQVPEAASLDVPVEKEPDQEASASFALAAANASTDIADIAFTVNVRRENLSNETDLGEARITMSVSVSWVEAHGGPEKVRIMRFSDGSTQILQTNLVDR